MTVRSGSASFSPMAKGMALPCVVWNESNFRYPAMRPEQPIPETMATFSRGTSSFIRALAKQFTETPIPQPLHQMWGMRSSRRNRSTGFGGTPPSSIPLLSRSIASSPGAVLIREPPCKRFR
jgi:hypothetical protein